MNIKQIVVRNDIAKYLTSINAKRICEVGVRDGAHLQALLVPSIEEAYAVDIWQETGDIGQNDERYSQEALNGQYQHVINLSKNDNRIKIVRGFSTSAATKFEDNYFDFVYIDADHSEKAVYEDLHAWWTKVKVGGVLAGHDYCGAFIDYDTYDHGRLSRGDHKTLKFGVIEAVARFISEKKISVYIDNETSFYIIRL